MNTTAAKLATGDGHFAAWLAEVRAKFDVADEFNLAAEIFSFAAQYEDGATPQEAYDEFDRWTSTEASL